MEQMRIMLVDDEERFLETTQKLLQKKGIEATTATSGEKALEMLRSHRAHVVILDVKMPGMDGIATLKEIKRQFPMVEVIMLTGHATVESAIEGLKSGATDYLMKPADIGEIIDKAKDAFSRRQHIEEKIRVAQMRFVTKSPQEILKETR
ncbi:MAG: response regulator [Proteobacteria bacterium]|nr:response regulator [Desulfobacteraceae bacterium]MBU4053768.1 response regulator [Pseudomonadota bacterium]MBU4316465.1 response regulator [Pseudomonadota bacterium]MBU4471928.1 response regulator [Pseudomonadota bacterium]MCG2752796.1 response regulator [Desulfobacteraceae bacterium]